MKILYKLTFSNGKSYIGQTIRRMITRITQHRQSVRTGSLLPVHCAWRMHGEPTVEMLGEFDTDEELHAAEIAAINSHVTLSPCGYNICEGGQTAPSKNLIVAEKISAAAVGRKYLDTTPWKDATTKMWQDESYREKVSEGLKNSWTPEKRAARSLMLKKLWEKRRQDGWSMSEQTKEKLRNKDVSDETRARMSASAINRKRTPVSMETRQKLSASLKASWSERTAKNQSNKF